MGNDFNNAILLAGLLDNASTLEGAKESLHQLCGIVEHHSSAIRNHQSTIENHEELVNDLIDTVTQVNDLLGKCCGQVDIASKAIPEMIETIGKLWKEIQRQQGELDFLKKFVVDSGEMIQRNNEGISIIMKELQDR